MCTAVKVSGTLAGWIARFSPPRTWQRLRIRWLLRSLAEPARAVLDAVPELPAVSDQLERTYLSIQEAFEKLATLSTQLVSDSLKLVDMALGRQTGVADFRQTAHVLERPRDFLNETVRQMPPLASELAMVRAAVFETSALEAALGRTLAPLKFMQTMFRVESASLPPESREIFVALAAQAGGVFERVEQSFDQQFATLRQLGATLAGTVESMERHHREHGASLRQRQGEVEASLSRMADELADNSRREVQLTEASEAFSKSVNNVIMALQTQDIVAQRLQHAVEGLSHAVDAITTAEANPDPVTAGKVSALASIEVAQLDEVAAELKRAEDALRSAIGTVLTRIGGLNEECLFLSDFKHLTVSVDGVVQVLVDSLAALREMTAGTLQTVRGYEEALRPAENALAMLTSAVDDVATTMGRIALNAQIRAIQVGHGTGLEVLASHIAELSRETVRISGDLSRQFSQASARVAGAMATLRSLRESGERALTVCDVDGAAEEASLHAFRDQALAGMQGLNRSVEQARAEARIILTYCDMSAPVEVLNEVRAAVARLAASSERLLLPVAVIQGVEMKQRYSMSAERVVHHRVLRQLGAENLAPARAQDMESNVELF